MEAYLTQRQLVQNKSWIRISGGNAQAPLNVTLPTYIRNSIHHPENTLNAKYTLEELSASIEKLYNLWPIT